MPREHPSLSPLQARKQLLLLEADLHRAQFGTELGKLNHAVKAVVHQAASLGSMVSLAALLVSGLSGFRRKAPTDRKPRLITRLFSLAKFATTAWIALRGRSG
jgi:hypothetical protein